MFDIRLRILRRSTLERRLKPRTRTTRTGRSVTATSVCLFPDATKMSTQMTFGSLKQIVPAPLKRAAREMQSQLRLRRAIDRIANLEPGELPSAEMLSELQAGWANDGFAARIDLLLEVAKQAATTAGPILECGSGITTMLMGILAGRRGVKTYAFEHVDEWRGR